MLELQRKVKFKHYSHDFRAFEACTKMHNQTPLVNKIHN